MKTHNLLVYVLTFIFALNIVSCTQQQNWKESPTSSDLDFTDLASRWDEGIPLENAMVGALVWEKDSILHMSLDRIDLWDLRPTDSLSGPNYKFSWVKEHIQKRDYLPVQKKFDWPYDRTPAPSKIPGAALEFGQFGAVKNVHLS